jgi:hypothetical protein
MRCYSLNLKFVKSSCISNLVQCSKCWCYHQKKILNLIVSDGHRTRHLLLRTFLIVVDLKAVSVIPCNFLNSYYIFFALYVVKGKRM